MSDNIIRVGNTPIFERLVQEMGERRFKGLLSAKGAEALQPATSFNLDLPKPAQDAQKAWGASAQEAADRLKNFVSAFPSASSWIAKPVPRILPEEPKLVETYSPNDLVDQAINPDLHMSKLVDRFREKFPEVHPVHVTMVDNIDGSVTVTVKGGLEQTDEPVNAGPRPVALNTISEVLRTEPTAAKIQAGVKLDRPRTSVIDYPADHIGEDVPDVLYMKPSAWGSDEE